MPRIARLPFVHARYEAGEILGAGAQGVVLRVRDREAPQLPLVAKVFRPGTFLESTLAGEYALLARLHIPGIVRAHDFGWDERTRAPFLVEEHIAGDDAAEWTRRAPPEERSARLLSIVASVARALSALHAAGFTHGDLKPAHVRMRDAAAPEAVLLDLGAAIPHAKAKTALVAFTPSFAAPEVIAGKPPSPLSDLYGLGALSWAIAAGKPRSPRTTRGLRDLAPWVAPRLAGIVEVLLAPRPEDRPASALDVLTQLGVVATSSGLALGAPPLPIGRERELLALALPRPGGVAYVTGPSGAGKSHLVRELATRARLSGRNVRHLVFPADAGASPGPLIGFLRGAGAWPFSAPPSADSPLLLVLDELELAPVEVTSALDAYRCRPVRPGALEIVATMRTAPDGADSFALGPLDQEAFRALCSFLGIQSDREIERAHEASGNNPGWLVAWAGRVPLLEDTALERAGRLSAPARKALAALAAAGGSLGEATLRRLLSSAARSAVSELLRGALVDRRVSAGRVVLELSARSVAADLAAALASGPTLDALARALLSAAPDETDARVLLTVAGARNAPVRRKELLDLAAKTAALAGRRGDEIEALVALLRDPEERTVERLLRLERLLRDSGMGPGYPEVLDWLGEAGKTDDRVRLLALRRQAERAGREGDAALARELSSRAIELADVGADPDARAFARGTCGLVALLRADWNEAETWLEKARSMLGDRAIADPEERARLEHNAGVVAIYRNRIDVAVATFERALATKRALGDRAGMRSCLMNLGIALGKADRDGEARAALDEAMKLARSLGQTSGLGWCLSALADVELRRRDARAAARWLSEAHALAAALPAPIRADLAIQAAQVALLDGDGDAAMRALEAVDPNVRRDDAFVDARALVALASAHLATLPPAPRAAARAAVQAARRSRAAALPEPYEQALRVLRSARARVAEGAAIARGAEVVSSVTAKPLLEQDSTLWDWLLRLPNFSDAETAATELCRALVAAAHAERAFVVDLDGAGRIRAAWGADLDGIALEEAARRIAGDVLDRALRQSGPLYQRDAVFTAGSGSRLVARHEARGGTSLVMVEHRFRTGAFDHVTASAAERWAALGAVAVRLGGSARDGGGAARDGGLPEGAAEAAEGALTTVIPLAESRRVFPSILGESIAIRRARARLDAAVDTELPVLVAGETGTGKELFARALHEHGPRRARELVAMSCGSVPEALFEAELFGHARGSFTGADRARPGLLARAEGGTLFLDEIGELPPARQAVLLRALESRRYRAVGSDDERPFDVRIVSATNRDLERAAAEGLFRSDLLYRLNAIAIAIPPLRARAGDVPLLVEAFLREHGRSDVEVDDDAMAALTAHGWPGNVRELRNLVNRLIGLRIARIRLDHLPRALRAAARPAAPADRSAPRAEKKAVREPEDARSRPRPPKPPKATGRAVGERAVNEGAGSERGPDDQQREAARAALEAEGGNISRAAVRLGLTRHGLKKRLRRLGLRNMERQAC